jgi:hypothetical protein
MQDEGYRRFLSPRLNSKFFEGRRGECYYSFYYRRPMEIKKALEKLITVEGDKITVRSGAYLFDYEKYIKSLGVKRFSLFGYNGGLVFQIA